MHLTLRSRRVTPAFREDTYRCVSDELLFLENTAYDRFYLSGDNVLHTLRIPELPSFETTETKVNGYFFGKSIVNSEETKVIYETNTSVVVPATSTESFYQCYRDAMGEVRITQDEPYHMGRRAFFLKPSPEPEKDFNYELEDLPEENFELHDASEKVVARIRVPSPKDDRVMSLHTIVSLGGKMYTVQNNYGENNTTQLYALLPEEDGVLVRAPEPLFTYKGDCPLVNGDDFLVIVTYAHRLDDSDAPYECEINIITPRLPETPLLQILSIPEETQVPQDES